MAARALARAGLVHAYGHCSVRVDEHSFIVTPPKPLGLVGTADAPVMVPDQWGRCRAMRCPRCSRISASTGIAPTCRRLRASSLPPSPHSRRWAARRARVMVSVPILPWLVPLHANPRLVRDLPSAEALAATLGGARAIVMRGNGAIAVGSSLEEALVMAWYLEDAARVELAVLATELAGLELSEIEARERAVTSGRIIERMWDYLTSGDPEGT